MHCGTEVVRFGQIAFDEADVGELEVTERLVVDEGATYNIRRMGRGMKVTTTTAPGDGARVKETTTGEGHRAIVSGELSGPASAVVEHDGERRVFAHAFPTKADGKFEALRLEVAGASTTVPIRSNAVTVLMLG